MKKVISIFLLLVLVFCIGTPVEAAVGDFQAGLDDIPNKNDSGLPTVLDTLSVLMVVAKFVALGATLYMGVRYIMASAEKKADLKTSLWALVIGTIVIYGAPGIIALVMKLIESST